MSQTYRSFAIKRTMAHISNKTNLKLHDSLFAQHAELCRNPSEIRTQILSKRSSTNPATEYLYKVEDSIG